MKLTLTHTLMIGVACLALSSVWAIAHLQTAKDAAIAEARDRRIVDQQTQQLRAAGVAVERTGTTRANDADEDMTGRIRQAATSAGISDQLLSIETSQSPRGEQGKPGDTSIFMRFNTITIGQLVGFASAAADPGANVRVSSIDLTTPDGAPPSPETWAAQLTLTAHSDTPARNP